MNKLKAKVFITENGLCKWVNKNNIEIVNITEFFCFTLFYREVE